MKDDVETPAAPPAKRRHLELSLDAWLATWAADENLPPSQRRRAQEERDRRKDLRKAGQPVVLGFTGTREGMTGEQRAVVAGLLDGASEVHHGDCVGADTTIHGMARQREIPVVIHPPEDSRLRAFCKGAARVEQARPFLERNQEIVKAATVLVATPKEGREPPPGRGQGTWSTVRYARQRGARVLVIMPDGSIPGGTP